MRKMSYCIALLMFVVLWGLTSLVFAQSNPWTQKGPMPIPRCYFTSSVVDDTIYVIGGWSQGGPIATVEAYDPATETWTEKTPMQISRLGLASSVLGGRIYVFGGIDQHNNVLDTVEAYDPVTNTWSPKASMSIKRAFLAARTVNGKIYVIGGDENPGLNPNVTGAVEEYDPSTNSWTTKASMPTQRASFATSVMDLNIYAFGGFMGAAYLGLSKVEMYDPINNTWTEKSSMPTSRWSLTSCVLDSMVYVIGGEEGVESQWPGVSVVEVYDPGTDNWFTRSSMPTKRRAHCACVVDGIIYVMGGTVGRGQPALSIVEAYNPALDPLTSVEDFSLGNILTRFVLQQNYPNPFNPTTNMEFSIPSLEFVTLKVYNILGEEVATLVSEQLPAGNYKYDWDGGRLASGVYLYRIQAGEYFESKKMVLLK